VHLGFLIREVQEGNLKFDVECTNNLPCDSTDKMKESLKVSFCLSNITRVKKIDQQDALIKEIIEIEEKHVIKTAKIGILLVREGQQVQEEMFANNENTPALNEFLNLLGSKVNLKGFSQYRGGLDNSRDSTGTASYFTTFNHLEIMFHVSTLLPHCINDKQHLEKKRHIGNDVTVIVFNESKQPFSHSMISSQFNQVYAVVHPTEVNGQTFYELDFSVKDSVPSFGPELITTTFERNQEFRSLLLTKVLNGERAAYAGAAFAPIIRRTLHQLLETLYVKYTK